MTHRPICPVILAGGTGTRLWPISRSARPKQFAQLAGAESLLSDTVRRLEDAGCGAPMFVTREEYRWAVEAEATGLGLADHRIVLEPEPRGTAAAICAAAALALQDSPDTLVLVSPSDQVVVDTLALADAVSHGVEAARDGGIVLFGVTPTSPETGFGYIKASEPFGSRLAQRFAGFVEKPDAECADEMVASGRFLWNAGIFLATAETLIAAFREFAPLIEAAVARSVRECRMDMSFLRLGPSYACAPKSAFDTAVMEKSNGWVVPLDAGWSDLGTWRGVWAAANADDAGCVEVGSARGIECKNSLLMSSEQDVEIVGLGLQNIAAVATRDAVLVVDLDHSQSVAKAVELLEIDGVAQSTAFTSDHRPWGKFEILAKGPRFQVKSIVVRPGGRLSLQSHAHRSEHWVVVEGTATVTVGEATRLVTENQSVYIPVGARHRLANDGRQPLRLIEVQTGNYLEEDDIVRYDDVYSRT